MFERQIKIEYTYCSSLQDGSRAPDDVTRHGTRKLATRRLGGHASPKNTNDYSLLLSLQSFSSIRRFCVPASDEEQHVV